MADGTDTIARPNHGERIVIGVQDHHHRFVVNRKRCELHVVLGLARFSDELHFAGNLPLDASAVCKISVYVYHLVLFWLVQICVYALPKTAITYNRLVMALLIQIDLSGCRSYVAEMHRAANSVTVK